MNRICACIFFITLFFSAGAQVDSITDPVDTTNHVFANVLYEKGEYQKAIDIYTKLIENNGKSAEIYYNLGNCYYKTDALGKSVLNYERALRLDPGDSDIQYNLDLVNLRIRDKMEAVGESVLLVWWRNFIKLLSVHTWAFLSVIILWSALTGFIIYRTSTRLRLQRSGFYLFTICLFLFVVTVIAAFSKAHHDKNYKFAVVMAPSTIIKSEPNESSTNMFLVHEGLKVQLLDEEREWTKIKMSDGNIGWLKNEDMEKVE